MKTQDFYTAIATKNLDASIHFYCDLLGFTQKHLIGAHGPVGRIAVLENEAGARVELLEILSAPDSLPINEGFSAMRTNVEDIDETVAELKAAGAVILVGPVDIAVGRSVVVRDPSGVMITFIQHIHK